MPALNLRTYTVLFINRFGPAEDQPERFAIKGDDELKGWANTIQFIMLIGSRPDQEEMYDMVSTINRNSRNVPGPGSKEHNR